MLGRVEKNAGTMEFQAAVKPKSLHIKLLGFDSLILSLLLTS
jgi:hypothetical protein